MYMLCICKIAYLVGTYMYNKIHEIEWRHGWVCSITRAYRYCRYYQVAVCVDHRKIQ